MPKISELITIDEFDELVIDGQTLKRLAQYKDIPNLDDDEVITFQIRKSILEKHNFQFRVKHTVPEPKIREDKYADKTVLPLSEFPHAGYLYVVMDSAHRDLIKIGSTNNPRKRIQQYNAHRPYPSCRYKYLSKPFAAVKTFERELMAHLMSKSQRMELRYEWFSRNSLDDAIAFIKGLENNPKLLFDLDQIKVYEPRKTKAA